MTRVFAAIDLGASGGRVMAGLVTDGVVHRELVHRFTNGARMRHGHLRFATSSTPARRYEPNPSESA